MIICDQKLSSKQLKEAHRVLAKAFEKDPLYQAVFGNQKELSLYLKLMLHYYNENGEIIVALQKDTIIAVSLWMFTDAPFFSFRKAVRSRMTGDILSFATKIRISSIIRLKKEALMTETYHYERKHHYLFLIASVKKGGGTALMEYAIDRFRDCPIYLENSNVLDNWDFYERLDFHLIRRLDVMGVRVDLLTNSKGD